MSTNDYTPIKRCRTCGNEYPATREFFNRNKRSKDGLLNECRVCGKIRHTASNRRLGHKPRTFSIVEDGKRRCTKCGEWFPNTLEYFSHDSQKIDGMSPVCKGCCYKAVVQWRKEHPEEMRERSRKQRKNNPEKARAASRLFIKRHPEQANLHWLKRYTRKQALPYDFTLADKHYAVDYFKGCCPVCGRPLRGIWHKLAMDHWIPLSDKREDNPGTVPSNMIPLCHGVDGCNNSKGKLDGVEWLIWRYGNRKAKPIINRIQDFFLTVRKV